MRISSTSFRKDLRFLIQLVDNIDQLYARNDPDAYAYRDRLKNIVGLFNAKYSGIRAKVCDSSLGICIKFFINRQDPHEILQDYQDRLKSRIFGSEYSYSARSSRTYGTQIYNSIILKRDDDQVEVLYRKNSLLNTASPEFQILLMHASPEENIDIRDNYFCFDRDRSHGSGLVYNPDNWTGVFEE